MHFRQLPYDRPLPPAPRPARQRDLGELAAIACWAIVMVCMLIGGAT